MKRNRRKRLKNILILVGIVILCVYSFKKITDIGINWIQKGNVKVDYEHEWDNMSDEDKKIIEKVISLSEKKLGTQYVWGGKGEIVTEERYNEFLKCYGESYYPLDKEDYIGIQGFDCSGLTYWTYKEASGVNIGYSTSQQQEVLKKYKVRGELQPGDLIFTTRHVVIYIGNGKVIHSKNKNKYPKGGIRKDSVRWYTTGTAYRVIDYINDVK